MSDALVIGAGPAGLMAAETLARAGRQVLLAEGKPSAGRKFLMAGKSGLNLTRIEPETQFYARYQEATPWLAPMLDAFGPKQVQGWAGSLGQDLFTGTTGRVFPVAMKASPLLRAWMSRMEITLRTRWHWQGWEETGGLAFDTPGGRQVLHPKVTVLALGGASWTRLGSDGAWASWLAAKGVGIAPFKPANMGVSVSWSQHMAMHFGAPVKNVALMAGAKRHRGEFVISARGLEGGGIYAVSRALREGAPLSLDLLPDLTHTEVTARLSRTNGKESQANYLRKTLRLTGARLALLQEFARPLPDAAALASLIKALPIPHQGPRPMEEAISTAGGVMRAAFDDGLMLRALPGIFCAGEMLDWEAPTGGYLITACLATGRWAGQHAANWAAP
ncbi:TIGR03862 family flavoprotein [Rhodophyticola sp. CCM32]|uniref:TIGR03862 family flavoprotein n=1 Tax=Rhodophyticola sp. CCM32 TaxID=2916397 RepID=UPI00107EF38F|nr:TIGR03862 family flavoprotein [Rhodophyticola sp. CCM32]QBY01833.1 TIGR03862 family flavoprotein [Rhodophyticola sp. CCM32]